MSKEFHAVLPEYVYEIMMDIVKNNNLSEREKSISEQLTNSTDSKINKSLTLLLIKRTKKWLNFFRPLDTSETWKIMAFVEM